MWASGHNGQIRRAARGYEAARESAWRRSLGVGGGSEPRRANCRRQGHRPSTARIEPHLNTGRHTSWAAYGRRVRNRPVPAVQQPPVHRPGPLAQTAVAGSL
jgi:hypothetical protein